MYLQIMVIGHSWQRRLDLALCMAFFDRTPLAEGLGAGLCRLGERVLRRGTLSHLGICRERRRRRTAGLQGVRFHARLVTQCQGLPEMREGCDEIVDQSLCFVTYVVVRSIGPDGGPSQVRFQTHMRFRRFGAAQCNALTMQIIHCQRLNEHSGIGMRHIAVTSNLTYMLFIVCIQRRHTRVRR